MSSIPEPPSGWIIQDFLDAHREPEKISQVLRALRAQIDETHPAWIFVAKEEHVEAQLVDLARRVEARGSNRAGFPLYGVPFVVKDNIDVAGWPTTAGCPAFRYVAGSDAVVVARLRAAGAIVLGKTNLDQFATGLVGTRSPYGVVPNAFDDSFIAGGSSSGSAFVVARGLVPFSLGTDTAGSGRVPAAFNNLVGLKPTRGRLSTRGVVPACRTLDCVSIFALCVEDAELVAAIAAGYDERDPYSRETPPDAPRSFPRAPRFAVPDKPEFWGDPQAEALFMRSIERLRELDAELVPVDFSPFRELAALLYEGPWVAERAHVAERLLRREPEAIHPVVRDIIARGLEYSAVQGFEAEYRRAELSRRIQSLLASFDALVVPTTPTIYRVREVEADPITTNSKLGIYTNFTNLADLSAIALPAGFREDGLPGGITLLSRAFRDQALADFGRRFQAHLALPLGATGRAFTPRDSEEQALSEVARDSVLVAVVGAHMTGLALNHELTDRGAKLVEQTRSASNYRLYALSGTVPLKPGLARDTHGASIELEVWEMPVERFGSFVRGVPPPLGIGSVELIDGRLVKGFICEPFALEGAIEITSFGGFRAYLASLSSASNQGV